MFIINWFKDVLGKLGLFKKSGKILFLGLDNAGKTTLMGLLKHGRVMTADPTQHVKSEELQMGSITFKAFDMGGHPTVRVCWKYYYPNVDGIIYLVDSSEFERLKESRLEL